ncbi:MAG: anthranilate synthase component I [Opitutales bacterium]
MNVHPTKSEFVDLARKGNIVPVYLDLTSDCETPLAAYWKLRSENPSFLFESIVGGERISRYSFLGTEAREVIRVHADETTVTQADGSVRSQPTPTDPLQAIEDVMGQYRPVTLPGMPPFTGGAVGFVGHEYIHYVEPTVPKPEYSPLRTPILYYLLTDSMLVFDHVRQVLRICVTLPISDNPEATYEASVERIRSIRERLETPRPLSHREIVGPGAVSVPPGNFTEQGFHDAVNRVKSYIRAGDVIQTVLSQRFEQRFTPSPIDLYRSLRTINPSPYMFLLEDPDFAVVGASPEVHVRLTGETVEIRPIAGTRQRGATEEEDRAQEQDLLADEKERAEHLMLVDLARNDIGRVCRFGSIQVPDFMTIERYSHVMHIVSQVIGSIAPGQSAFDLMRATFPAGTLSGAPKIRALQIIAELENSQRGIYGGALGYFSYEGNHDSCIGIRTAVLQDGKIFIQSGAGIVADSVPESEFEETVNKAKAMLKAVALAEKMA